MNAQQLSDKYGKLYPGIKLPPCVTADGVEFEFGMTLWRISYDDTDEIIVRSYETTANEHDIYLKSGNRGLQWWLCDKRGLDTLSQPINELYVSENEAWKAAIKVLDSQVRSLEERIAAIEQRIEQ